MRRNVRQRTFGHVRPAKILISLRICAFAPSDQTLHRAIFEQPRIEGCFLVDNDNSDQAVVMRRLI